MVTITVGDLTGESEDTRRPEMFTQDYHAVTGEADTTNVWLAGAGRTDQTEEKTFGCLVQVQEIPEVRTVGEVVPGPRTGEATVVSTTESVGEKKGHRSSNQSSRKAKRNSA